MHRIFFENRLRCARPETSSCEYGKYERERNAQTLRGPG